MINIIRTYQQHKKIASNLFWRSVQILGKQGFSFFIFFMVARVLNPYDFGIYSYLLATISLFTIFSDFGVSMTITKLVAEIKNEKNEKISQVISSALTLIISISIVVILLGILLGEVIFQENYKYALALFPLVILIPTVSLYDGLYLGLKQFKKLSALMLMSGVLATISTYFLINKYEFYGAIFSQNLFYLLLLTSLYLGQKKIQFKPQKVLAKRILNYSLLIGLSNISYFLYTRADVLILAKNNLIYEIGVYEILNKVIVFLLLPVSIISQVISPDIARHNSQKNSQAILQKAFKYLFIVIAFSVVTSLLLFFLFPLLLATFLPSYQSNITLLLMNSLLFVFVFQAAAHLFGNGFSIFTGHAKLNASFLICFGLINVLLGLLLIGNWGVYGLIANKLFIGTTSNILFILLYYKKLKFQGAHSNEK